jgi:hypothetical protein
MVRNQATDLICDHYYNSCFKFSNEECDPTLYIYAFQKKINGLKNDQFVQDLVPQLLFQKFGI